MDARRIGSARSAAAVARILAGLVLVAPIFRAAAQSPANSATAVGLPPASSITGTIHRAPDGRIVVDPARGGPPGSPATSPAAPIAIAPSAGSQGANRDISGGPVRPPGQPSGQPNSARPANGANDWDEVSCRSMAWENIDHQQCRRDLAAARARLPAGKNGTAGGN
jgi:hypothetical protein